MPPKILVFVFSNFLTIYAEESIHDSRNAPPFSSIFFLPFLNIRSSSNIHNFCPSCFYMIHILFFCKLWNKSGREILQLFSFKTLQIFLASTFFLTSWHLLCNIDTVSLHICYKFYRLKNFKTGARIIFILILQQNLFVANFKGR